MVVTREGKTARLLSALRPSAPIYAVSPSERSAGRLALCCGVIPYVNAESDVQKLYSDLLHRGYVQPGSMIVFINVSPELNRIDANFLIVQRVVIALGTLRFAGLDDFFEGGERRDPRPRT